MSLKIDELGRWIEFEWYKYRNREDYLTLWITNTVLNEQVLTQMSAETTYADGYQFVRCDEYNAQAVPSITQLGRDSEITDRTGSYLFRFEKGETRHEVLVLAGYYTDNYREGVVALAAVPRALREAWDAFETHCNKLLRKLEPQDEVVIIGGMTYSFKPNTELAEVILPAELKSEILEDVESFFTKGIEVYRKLKLKPFRKMLLAGVPGTGKTMLCSAIAKWAIERQYLVIYVSSADFQGATFGKIQRALHIASNSNVPTLLLLEEIDAYLHAREKALILNVLDGSETSENDAGTLMIATTNYPEAIDDRVMKRPGRMDRIFIIPETRSETDATAMLKMYLGEQWRDEHAEVAMQLVGYPGAFIRELAIYALTQVARRGEMQLPLDVLAQSFQRLKDQIQERDAFLYQRMAERNKGEEENQEDEEYYEESYNGHSDLPDWLT